MTEAVKKCEEQIEIFADCFVDSFAGGGGASTGIELALGRPVDIAINHDMSAIMMHKRNHPYTEHYREDIWQVDPVTAVRGRHVRLAWFSPDCKHFSRAKGAALVDRHIRGLAWVVLRWAGTVHPDVIMLENVPEFVTWGPVRKGKPVKSKAGQTYRKWRGQLEDLGYKIDTRELCAADYGAPTIRTRFCLIASRDGCPIVWPERTHAPRGSEEVASGKCLPWRAASEIIDWALPCYSIFESKEDIRERYGVTAVRPLADNTMRRIARGLDKFVIRSAEPFIVSNNTGNAPHSARMPVPTITTCEGRNLLCAPSLIQYHSEQSERVRGQRCDEPMMTVDASNRYGLSAAYLTQYFSGDNTQSVENPLNTITTHDRENLTLAHLAHFKGQDKGQDPREPLMTITQATGQFGEVRTTVVRYDGDVDLRYWPRVRELLNRHCGYTLGDDDVLLLDIRGAWYFISDIGLRMLTPRELYDAMGFPHDYIIDRYEDGTPIRRADQVARCGNAVCPAVSEALVRANLPECHKGKIGSMRELRGVM